MLIFLTALLAASPDTITAPGLPDDSLALRPGAVTEFVSPEGGRWPLTVLRSELQPSGTEVWVARVGEAGAFHRAIVTSGHGAVFGWISTPEGDWQIAPVEAGGTSVAQRAVLADDAPLNDVLRGFPQARRAPSPDRPAEASAVPVGSNGTVDIAVVYTEGMESFYGLGVVTRAQHLINVLDQALIDSDTGLRVRMVHAQPLGVPWIEQTSTLETIDDLVAGASFGHPGTSADVFGTCEATAGLQCNNDGDLSHLYAMRNGKAADIVIMLRRYWRHEQTYCGVAYLPGAGAVGSIDPASDHVLGVAVTGDGPDANGTGASCGDLTFAHEIGHNLGSHHNVENAGGQFGLFTYSYGHRVDCSFRTIMGYHSSRSGVSCPNGGQFETWIAAFSNPDRLICRGEACGIAADRPAMAGADDNTTPADNARSIRTEGWRVREYRDPPAPAVVTAVLPSSRAVGTGVAATAFVTIVNPASTGSTATACGLRVHAGNSGGSFSYQTTDPATNAITGTPDTPVDIPAGASQSYVIAISRTSLTNQAEIRIDAQCANRITQTVIPGLNTLLFTALPSVGPDIISVAATSGSPGRLSISAPGATGAFAVAVTNAGAPGDILFTARAATGAQGVGQIHICRTDPATAQCLTPRLSELPLTLGANETATFSVFVTATGSIANQPAANRILFQAAGASTGRIVGSTSVAVRTEPE
ncbi:MULTISPECIES: reprolysin-like metallopeptidase [Hyphobacterium]|uniref:Reprolysin-like metallopeptidase n=1 Tax=Hyphobacterium vulgare TaxID=1736751 RepID=A0ABV6ZVF6_9PROT